MVIIDKIKSLFTVKKSVSISESTRYFYSLLGFGNNNFDTIQDEKLIREAYLSNEDIYAIIEKVIQSSLTIPICLYKKQKDEVVKVEDKNNQLFKLVSNPNKNQTLKEYREEQYLNYLLTGDLFELKIESVGFEGKPSSMRILPSQFVTIEYENNDYFFGDIKKYNFFYSNQYSFTKDEVIHLQKLNPAYPFSGKGLSPLHPAYTSISTSNQVHLAEKSMIENKGAVGLLSQNMKEGYGMTPEERTNLDNDLKDRIGGASNYGKIITSSADLKYLQLGSSVKDLTLAEIDINKLRKFCNVFGLASQMMNDPLNKTFNSLGEAKKSLYLEASIPLAQKMIEQWNKYIVPLFNEKNAEYFLELDIESIEVLQRDKKQEAQKDKIVTDTVLSILEKMSMGVIDRQTAINILVYANGFSTQDAEMLIPTMQQTQNVNNANANNQQNG